MDYKNPFEEDCIKCAVTHNERVDEYKVAYAGGSFLNFRRDAFFCPECRDQRLAELEAESRTRRRDVLRRALTTQGKDPEEIEQWIALRGL